jgi:hypothetical protein
MQSVNTLSFDIGDLPHNEHINYDFVGKTFPHSTNNGILGHQNSKFPGARPGGSCPQTP